MAISADVGKAVELYYSKLHLDSNDITALYGGISRATICKLKEKARVVMQANGIPLWNSHVVETKSAYTAWGLDISDLETRYSKLKKYGFIKEG